MIEKLYQFKPDILYCGDNLDVLQFFPDECVDLIYIDPPFFSGKNYDIVFGDEWALQAFDDTFKLEKDDEESTKMEKYLNFMEVRIRELHRVLKSTGSFYLHCDYHASHYLKVLCDKIFGYNNFLNEIVWNYNRWTNVSKNFQRMHDIILFYSKTSNNIFNVLTKDKIQDKIYHTNTVKDGNKRISQLLVYNKEKFNKLDKKEVLLNKYDKVVYVEKKIALDDVWNIPILNSQAKERLGYPTQKPESLLERIIKASSNEGDIVLDCFAGCGTTLAVAKRLNRHFIGIDVSPIGCNLVAERIDYPVQKIMGYKTSIEKLEEMDWYAFQCWAIRSIGGRPNPKKTVDGGIDGKISAIQSTNKFDQDIPIEVKQGKNGISRPTVQKLHSVIITEKKKGGVVIGWKISNEALKYIKDIKNESGIEIIFVSIDEIVNGLNKPKKGLKSMTTLEKFLHKNID